jgi:cysteine desulfurase/selenocysteine lyase
MNITDINILNPSVIRKDFPILNEKVHGKPLIFFDSAATSQKPQIVIDHITRYYSKENANIHRGVYELSANATDAYEATKHYIAEIFNCEADELVYTRGTTESINLVAHSWGTVNIKAGDEILITEMEHHANIVPWQILCNQTGGILKVAKVTDDGEIDIDDFNTKLTHKTKLVTFTQVSNSIGTINPACELVSMAKSIGATVLVDGCQAAPHLEIDLKNLGADFFVFSGHKVFAPTGIGILYGKKEILEKMIPYQSGGDMIDRVTFEKTTYNAVPHIFEAGTPHICGAIVLKTALEYVENLGRKSIEVLEQNLLNYFNSQIHKVDGVKVLGNSKHKIPVFSMVAEGAHPLDIGTFLDFEGIAVRTGNHCTQPLIQRFGYDSTFRVSLSIYNTEEEIDTFVDALQRILKKLR